VLVFIHLDTREIIVTTSTAKPNSKWVEQQACNFLAQVADRDDRPRTVKNSAELKTP